MFNPIITKKYRQGDVHKRKNDRIDAKRIAEIGLREQLHEFVEDNDVVALKRKIVPDPQTTRPAQIPQSL